MHSKTVTTAVTASPGVCCSAYSSTLKTGVHVIPISLLTFKNYPALYTRRQNSSLMKNGVFWVVTPCGSCKNRRFGGTWRLLHQGDKNR
jgi:hypothetical protein